MLQRKKRLKGFWKAILILNKTNTIVLSAVACFSGASERCHKRNRDIVNRVGYVTKNITGKMNMELNIETLVEELRTTILWENVGSYIESVKEANKLLQQPDLKGYGQAEKASIMDSEDFYVIDIA